jgi:hypothetical protein
VTEFVRAANTGLKVDEFSVSCEKQWRVASDVNEEVKEVEEVKDKSARAGWRQLITTYITTSCNNLSRVNCSVIRIACGKKQKRQRLEFRSQRERFSRDEERFFAALRMTRGRCGGWRFEAGGCFFRCCTPFVLNT